MSTLKEIRKQTGLSQYEMAGYLCVSRSMVNLVEMGLRDLRGKASLKLSHLFFQLLNNQKAGENITTGKNESDTIPEKISKLAKYHKRKMEDCRYRLILLQRELIKIKSVNEQANNRFALMRSLNEPVPYLNKTAKDEKWIEWQQLESSQQVSKKSVAEQILQSRIDVLMAYASVHETEYKKCVSGLNANIKTTDLH